MHAVTGWTDGLSQDYNKKLGQWFANRLGAKEQLRKDYEMTTPQYELPEPFGEMQYRHLSGTWGRLEGYTSAQMREAFQAGLAASDKELSVLREYAAMRYAPTVIATLGPMSLWSKNAFDKEIAKAEQRGYQRGYDAATEYQEGGNNAPPAAVTAGTQRREAASKEQ